MLPPTSRCRAAATAAASAPLPPRCRRCAVRRRRASRCRHRRLAASKLPPTSRRRRCRRRRCRRHCRPSVLDQGRRRVRRRVGGVRRRVRWRMTTPTAPSSLRPRPRTEARTSACLRGSKSPALAPPPPCRRQASANVALSPHLGDIFDLCFFCIVEYSLYHNPFRYSFGFC